jgi:hypothetical protein
MSLWEGFIISPGCFLQLHSIARSCIAESFREIDSDVLINGWMCHDCFKIPTKQTLPLVIEEMAHKELIQAPMFVCDCFHPVMKNLTHADELEKVYKN